MARRVFSKSSNPFLKEEALVRRNFEGGFSSINADRMTVSGAVNKTLVLAGIMLLTAVFGYANPSPLFIWGGAIGGLVVVLITSFKPTLSPVLAPVYAALEGLFVGGISAIYASMFNGIVFQAVTLTFAVLFMMLFVYKSGMIRVTDKFRRGVVMATGAIAVVYLLNLVLSMFGINMPYLHEGGMIGIGISLVIVGVAALNLLLDFDAFETGERMGAPAYMEWFMGMGLLITLVWLYIEILRLVAMFSRD